MDDKNIEVYDNQEEVLNRIQVLKSLGYEEHDMYIIANDDEDFSMLRGFTDVIIKEDDDSLWDKFKSFLQGEDSVIDAFHRMGLGEEDREFYYDQVKAGKIVLYVNKDYGSYYEVYEDGSYGPIVTTDESIEDINQLEKESEFEVFEEDGTVREVVVTEDRIDPERKGQAESDEPVDELDFEAKKHIGLLQEQPPLEDLRRDQDIDILIEQQRNRPI